MPKFLYWWLRLGPTCPKKFCAGPLNQLALLCSKGFFHEKGMKYLFAYMLSNLAKTLVHKIILVFMQQNIFREKLQEKGGKMLSPFLKFVMQSLENKVVTWQRLHYSRYSHFLQSFLPTFTSEDQKYTGRQRVSSHFVPIQLFNQTR